MTSIFVCSDLHTNFHRDGGKSLIDSCHTKDVDIIVVAGDLSTHSLLEENIKLLCSKYPDVVYVTGNHEYYHSSFDYIDDLMRNLDVKISNFHFLNNDRVQIDGLYFIGTTLWFPYSTTADAHKHFLNDFRCIADCDPKVYEKYEEAVEFLDKEMKSDDIVVTHHLPTHESVNAKYKASILNCFFACDLDNMIRDKAPELWIHGHTHHSCDYTHYATRIVANPFGYPGENNSYDDNLIIEV